MRILLVSALALGALSSAALAEPARLTDAQMDGVTAAGFIGLGTAFGTRVAAFDRTIVPPVFDPIPPLLGDRLFDLPRKAVIVIDDDRDLVRLRKRKDIRLALPARRDFRADPVTVIVVKNRIFVADGALRD